MRVLGLVFAAWAAVGGGFYWLLQKLDWPREWLIAYGFGSLVLFLLWAILSSNKKRQGNG